MDVSNYTRNSGSTLVWISPSELRNLTCVVVSFCLNYVDVANIEVFAEDYDWVDAQLSAELADVKNIDFNAEFSLQPQCRVDDCLEVDA